MTESKEKTLAFLERNRGVFVSGEEIAAATATTRAAVNKHVKALRQCGYDILAAPNRGYMLAASTDYISASGIAKYLSEPCRSSLRFEILEETASTNLTAREAGERGEGSGLVVIARRQTHGRGRRGRNFFSDGGGIYMSVLLRRPGMTGAAAARLTTNAALAVCEAIEASASLATSGSAAGSVAEPPERAPSPRIKWVNDVFLRGLKVCGILTEGQVGVEEGTLEYAVVGIGVNLYPPLGGFPAELSGIAGSVFDGPRADGRNFFIGELLNRFFARLERGDASADLAEYRRRLLAQGRGAVVCLPDGRRFEVRALDVDDDYRLIAEFPDGTREAIAAGDVSVRPTETDDAI